MVKQRVGHVPHSTYDLPESSFVYGKAEEKDAEGVAVIVSSWKSSQASKPKESQRSFLLTNKIALKEGCITAKSQRSFAQDHEEIRFKEKQGSRLRTTQKPVFKGPYGLPTECSKDSIQNLIEAEYTEYQNDNFDYPDLSSLEQKRRLKAPKQTKASIGHDIRSKSTPPPNKVPFKLKRFSNIQSRVQIPSPPAQ